MKSILKKIQVKRKSAICIYAFIMLFSGVSFASVSDDKDIYDIVMERVQAKHKSVNIQSIDATTATYMNTVKSDGSFADIDYTDKSQTNWKPISHLDRLKYLVLSYTVEESQYYQNNDVYRIIVNMLDYWYKAYPQSSNWYNQQIGCPQRMGVILILMRSGEDKTPIGIETDLLNRMRDTGGAPDQGGSQGTGANKLDIATHWVYRGCLTKDKTVFDKGVQQAFYPLFYTTDEGFQHDYSYLQHSLQLYVGGYGDVIASGICNLAKYVEGTAYELESERFEILANYIRKTYLPVIRGQYFLYNVAGRSLSRPNSLGKSGFVSTLQSIKEFDTSNEAEYNAAIKRLRGEENTGYGLNPYHAHYWRSDYTLHQRPGYTMDVRMVSTKTCRNENGNNENLKGYFLADGAMDIAVDGNEYVNIFPVWDWGRIPGTTTPALTTIPQPGQWGVYGTATFTGGVSDGVYGVSVYSQYDYKYSTVNMEAKKAWFFFDDEVVCLGTDIKSTSATEVNTTLNQCLLSGDVTVIKDDRSSEVLTKGLHSYSNEAKWVLHNKVGYYLPDGGRVRVSNQSQKGNWYSINANDGYSKTDTEMDVFKMWLTHGTKPTKESYSYVIVPNVNTVEKVNSYNTDNIEIIHNTGAMQAVRHKGLGIIGIIFYAPGTFKYGNNISVRATQACAIMLKDIESDEVKVHIADPSRVLPRMSLITTLPGISGTKELKCEFPLTAAQWGSTQKYIINAETPDYVVVEDPNTYVIVSEDAYAHGGNKTTNYGSDSRLEIKTDSEAYSRQAFLKFNIADIDFSAVGPVNLVLTVLEGDDDYLNNTIHLKPCNSDWSEASVNWNTKPVASGDDIATLPAVNVGNDMLFDIKDYLAAQKASGKTEVSFLITNTFTGSVAKTRISFHSKESLYEELVPRLRIAPLKTSLEENKHSRAVMVYPNPAQKGNPVFVNIDNEIQDYEIRVSDFSGKILIRNKEKTINTADLNTGMYIVSVVDKAGIQIGLSKILIK